MDNMGITIVCYLGFDVVNFEIDVIFLIKPCFLHAQKVKTKKCKCLENKKSFQDEIKNIFHHF